MPSSLIDLQNFWRDTGPTGGRFDADRTIKLVVEKSRRYEAALRRIARKEGDAAQVAIEALGFDPTDQAGPKAEKRN